MARRFAAYNAGQPPRTASRAAIPDKVSPGCTTYPATGRAAAANTAATVPGPVTWVVLPALRMSAWAARPGWLTPAATTTIIKMLPQASTTHADFVHIRNVVSLSFQRGSAPGATGPDAEGTDRSGRKAT
jgi:hypothetical protein